MLSRKTAMILSIALGVAGFVQLTAQTVPESTQANVQKLISVLQSKASRKEKADACRQLGVIGTKDAVAPLAALLGDQELSHMARYALEPIPDPAVDKALRDALGSVQGKPLVGVIGSIGVRKDASAVQSLSRLLNHTEPDVVQAALRALGRIGNEPATKILRNHLRVAAAANQLAAFEALFRVAESMTAKGDMAGATAVYDLVQATRGAPHQVRAGALRGAVLSRGKEGLTLLSETLRSEDPVLFAAAVKTSVQMKDPGVSSLLIAALSSPVADRQIPVVQALGKRGDKDAVPALMPLARKAERPVRIEALRALTEIADPAAVPLLVETLSDSEPLVAQAAVDCLSSFPGGEADRAAIALLRSPDAKMRVSALELLEVRRAPAGLAELTRAAADPEPKVQRGAIRVLGKLGGPSDLPFLIGRFRAATEPEDLTLMSEAFSDLGIRSTDREAYVSSLVELLPVVQPQHQCALIRVFPALGGEKALRAVRVATKDANVDVQRAAVRALASWKSADAAPDLLAVAQNPRDPSDRTLAVRGYTLLAGSPDVTDSQRWGMCREASAVVKTDDEKKMLLSLLGKTLTPDALDMAMQHLDNPATREEAGAAAVLIADAIVAQKPAEVKAAMQKVLGVSQNQRTLDRAKNALAKAK
ncbi:MAG: HEAT repeat domain-containing protein [Acidobacteria bacterium]|nr:MAG: HEAT repeat domain-containing protein [Acidobacteriota bacterium]